MSREESRENFDLQNVVRGAVAGAIGGFVASWVMNKAHDLMHKATQPTARTARAPKEKESSEEPATVKTAVAISQNVLHHRLTKREKQIVEPIVHYGYGTIVGALYGAAAEIIPEATMGRGTAYASALWLFGDEVAVPALGLSKPPTEFPVSTHAEALAAHLIYGLTLEAARRASSGLLP